MYLAARPGIRASMACARPSFGALSLISRRADAGAQLRYPSSRAWESTTANASSTAENASEANDDNKVKEEGHIGVKPNESVLFFDSKQHLMPQASDSTAVEPI